MRLPMFLLLTLSSAISSVAAQTTSEVSFNSGNFGTMVTGAISGDDYADYTLRAKDGQELFVELTVAETDGTGTAYFNILPPGSENVGIYNSSINGNTTTVDLQQSGLYTIRVYLMGNDRDAGKTVRFNMDLSIQ